MEGREKLEEKSMNKGMKLGINMAFRKIWRGEFVRNS